MKKNFLLLLLLLLTTTGYAQSQANEPRDSIVMQSTVYFAINQGEQIDPAYYKAMEKFLQWAKADKATPIVIAGWADKSGTRGFNQVLSLPWMNGMPRYMHNANMTWQSGVRIGWLFGKESKKWR